MPVGISIVYTPENIMQGDLVTFIFKNDTGITYNTYTWKINGVQVKITTDIIYKYTFKKTGSYMISVIATNSSGGSTTATVTVTINPFQAYYNGDGTNSLETQVNEIYLYPGCATESAKFASDYYQHKHSSAISDNWLDCTPPHDSWNESITLDINTYNYFMSDDSIPHSVTFVKSGTKPQFNLIQIADSPYDDIVTLSKSSGCAILLTKTSKGNLALDTFIGSSSSSEIVRTRYDSISFGDGCICPKYIIVAFTAGGSSGCCCSGNQLLGYSGSGGGSGGAFVGMLDLTRLTENSGYFFFLGSGGTNDSTKGFFGNNGSASIGKFINVDWTTPSSATDLFLQLILADPVENSFYVTCSGGNSSGNKDPGTGGSTDVQMTNYIIQSGEGEQLTYLAKSGVTGGIYGFWNSLLSPAATGDPTSGDDLPTENMNATTYKEDLSSELNVHNYSHTGGTRGKFNSSTSVSVCYCGGGGGASIFADGGNGGDVSAKTYSAGTSGKYGSGGGGGAGNTSDVAASGAGGDGAIALYY